MTRFVTVSVGVALALGCGDGGDATISHRLPAIDIAAGQEIADLCQSWTLDNDDELYVTVVRAHNDGGFHHSNWVFVPEHMFEGPDGTWPCAERGFHEAVAAATGGVFFAQSTQALEEEQRLPEGSAIRIRPRSRVVGAVHLLNTTGRDLRTALRFDVETVPPEEVGTRMQLMRFNIGQLDIAARSRTEHSMDCDVAGFLLDDALDFRFHYVLPHYHELGVSFRLEATGGPEGPIEVYDSNGRIGDVLGGTLDPPVDVSGATGLRVTCTYDNPRDEAVGFGIGDQEMCVMLAFTDAGWKIDAGDQGEVRASEREGVQLRQTDCRVQGAQDR